MSTVEYLVHNQTKAQGLIQGATPTGYIVQWLKSGDISTVNLEDITVISVPVPEAVVFEHGVDLHGVELLEQQFTVLTSDGWKIPEWITRIRNTITRHD